MREPLGHVKQDPTLQRVLHWEGVLGYEDLGADREAVTALSPREGISYVGMVTARGHYLLEVEDASFTIFDSSAAVEPSGPGGPLSGGGGGKKTLQGWSGGVDNRNSASGISGVGRVNGTCSGALISSRVVRTAAHCIIQHNSSGTGIIPSSIDYNDGEDSTSWGTQTDTSTYFYGGSYISNDCAETSGSGSTFDYWAGYRDNFSACTWADWGYLVLDSDWYGSGDPWYFGWTGASTGMELRSGGYPVCSGPGSPGCSVAGTYYVDSSGPCKVHSFTSGTAKWKSGCDMSAGNSGGPAWKEGTGYLIGHCQWEDCIGDECTGNAPNHYLGHDSWLWNYQLNLRNTYP